jgi:hypothetical protein
MNAKRISGALMVSLVIHAVLLLIASTFHITRTERLKDVVNVQILPPTKPPRPIVRGGRMAKYIAKYMVVKPTISADRSFVMGQVQVQPRITTHAVVRPASSVHPQTVLEFSSKVVKLDSAIPPQLNPPNGVRPASSVHPQTVLEFSSKVVKLDSAIPPQLNDGIVTG